MSEISDKYSKESSGSAHSSDYTNLSSPTSWFNQLHSGFSVSSVSTKSSGCTNPSDSSGSSDSLGSTNPGGSSDHGGSTKLKWLQ